jgi:threonine synthase
VSIWRWGQRLAAVPIESQLTLGEGNTPLVRSRRIGPRAGLERLYFKLEMVNPSGSYKDRFAACAVSHMLAEGKTRCLATSSGNTGAALAAYCAAAGIRCEIAIVETAPLQKLTQMLAYGAILYRIRRFGLNQDVSQGVFAALEENSQSPEAALQISAFRFSPQGMTGVQSIGYELLEQAPVPLDHVFCPAGGGGMVVAVARAFQQMQSPWPDCPVPRVEVVQPEGNDTIVTPMREGAPRARDIQCTSEISGLQVPNDIDGTLAIESARATGGSGQLVTDEQVWEVQGRLAREEGIFCEPAGAVAVAGALNALAEGRMARDAAVVCMVTGSGFKDAKTVDRMAGHQPPPLLDLADFRRQLSR